MNRKFNKRYSPTKRTKKTIYDRPNGVMGLDRHVEKMINEIAIELDLNYTIVRKAVMHFFNWNRDSMSKAQYSAYSWSRFGKFEFFQRKRNPDSLNLQYRNEVIRYNNIRTLKDKNREFNPQDIQAAKDSNDYSEKLQLIEEIKKYPLSLFSSMNRVPTCLNRYKHLAWWIGGNKQKGDWNTTTMILEPIETLKNCVECLNNNINYDGSQKNA